MVLSSFFEIFVNFFFSANSPTADGLSLTEEALDGRPLSKSVRSKVKNMSPNKKRRLDAPLAPLRESENREETNMY